MKKIRISELPEADSLNGLHTIGVDASNNSVKVSLDAVSKAAEEVDEKISLATRKPNLVGEFDDDSTVEDWYWWPNGVKTALPVDPVTKRFEVYYPDVLQSASYLFAGGAANSDFVCRLKALYKVPASNSVGNMLRNMTQCEVLPEIDCANVQPTFNVYFNCAYVVLNTAVKHLYLRNTEAITGFEMTVNATALVSVDGIDLTSANTISAWPFGVNTARINAVNLGKAQTLSTADFRSNRWGNDSVARGARKSVVDTLLTHSYDRTAAGYAPVSIQLSAYTLGLLTDEEKSAISAKGYTLVESSN